MAKQIALATRKTCLYAGIEGGLDAPSEDRALLERCPCLRLGFFRFIAPRLACGTISGDDVAVAGFEARRTGEGWKLACLECDALVDIDMRGGEFM